MEENLNEQETIEVCSLLNKAAERIKSLERALKDEKLEAYENVFNFIRNAGHVTIDGYPLAEQLRKQSAFMEYKLRTKKPKQKESSV